MERTASECRRNRGLRGKAPLLRLQMKPKKTFADIAASRRRYNPEVEGYGSPTQWQEAFRVRMDLEEARQVVGDRTPRGILGVGPTATLAEIKQAFRKLIVAFHPDRIATSGLSIAEATRRTREVNAAYAVLVAEFRS